MKGKFIVIFAVQFVILLFMILYALVQKSRADEQIEIAVQQRERAIEQYKLAEEFRAQLEHCNKK